MPSQQSEGINLFRYGSVERAVDTLLNRTLWFANPRTFNDVFDSNIELLTFDLSDPGRSVHKDIKRLQQQFGQDIAGLSKEEIQQIYRESVKNKLSRTSVLCMSLSSVSHTLWGNYASDHKGIALGFQYSGESPFTDVPKEKLTTGPVTYEELQPSNYISNKKEGILKLLFSKRLEWKDEQEFRFAAMISPGAYKIEPWFLKSVIFGVRTTQHDIDRVLNIIDNTVIAGQIRQDRFDLVVEPYR